MISDPAAAFVLRGAIVMSATGDFDGPRDVAVADGLIAAVADNLPTGPDITDLDATGLFLLPGIIDTHLHATLHSFDGWEQVRTRYSYRIAETLAALRRTLHAGVTTVRDAGGADAGLAHALRDGLAEGPDLQVSVVGLSILQKLAEPRRQKRPYMLPDLVAWMKPAATCDPIWQRPKTAMTGHR